MDASTNSASSFVRSSDNVVKFPKKNIRNIMPVDSEITKEAARRVYVDEIVEAYAISFLNRLAQQGFDVFDKRFERHYGFTMEALRSTLLMTFNIEHPFQDIIDNTVKMVNEVDKDDDDYDPA